MMCGFAPVNVVLGTSFAFGALPCSSKQWQLLGSGGFISSWIFLEERVGGGRW